MGGVIVLPEGVSSCIDIVMSSRPTIGCWLPGAGTGGGWSPFE